MTGRPKTTQPVVGMKINFPFQVSICTWFDLLGYGAGIKRAQYNPLDHNAKVSVDRVRAFHQIVADHSVRNFPTLVMNDGATAYRDLSYRTSWPTFDFIRRSVKLFESISKKESERDFPGVRMVISAGFRLRGRTSQSSALRGDYVRKILSELSSGKMDIGHAITKASQFRRPFDVIPQLQANFAFTKAYIAEQSGANSGLPGPACYLDDILVKRGDLDKDTLVIDGEVDWASDRYGLDAKFLGPIYLTSHKPLD